MASKSMKVIQLIPEQVVLLLDTMLDILKKEEEISERAILETIEDDQSNQPMPEIDNNKIYVKKKEATNAVKRVLRHIVEERLEAKIKGLEATEINTDNSKKHYSPAPAVTLTLLAAPRKPAPTILYTLRIKPLAVIICFLSNPKFRKSKTGSVHLLRYHSTSHDREEGRCGGILDEMASREMLEDVIEWLTKRLKLANATLRLTNEEFQQTKVSLEVLKKEHKRVIQLLGELKERESTLISERDKARESAKKALEKVSEMESEQFPFKTQFAKLTLFKPEKFLGSVNDTDFQAFLD
ncbi:hypothetical protein AWC38_SpisGene23931 [Stylophora pistillata]|uniref:Uncharacterized protein n=1 Tax=Stylophora pistillata TaxID=50429 RepID=A0A2B4R5R6_STYPI|nr:hypothetical protein AWC38_SpisGene23931 [Stylophora pistillata]